MSKAKFEDFIFQNPNCKSLESSIESREIFDILNDDEHIIAAIDASEVGQPALSPSVYDIETWITNKNLAKIFRNRKLRVRSFEFNANKLFQNCSFKN